MGSPRQADLVEGEGRGGAGLRLPHDGQHYRGGNNAVEYGGGHGWQEDIFPKNDRGENYRLVLTYIWAVFLPFFFSHLFSIFFQYFHF